MTLLHRAWREYKNVGLTGLVASTLWFLKMNLWVAFHLLLERVSAVVFDRSDSRVWVFGTNKGFTQNPKYLFLYVANERPSIRPIWISHTRETVSRLTEHGYEAYYAYSLNGLYYLTRASHLFFMNKKDDVGFWGLTGGATSVQLWHGNPLKDGTSMPWHLATARGADRVLLTSSEKPADLFFERPFTTDDWDEFVDSQALVCGYPRNDIFFREVPDFDIGIDREELDAITQLSADHTVFAYLPTWRPYEDRNPLLDDESALADLDSALDEIDGKFIVKMHPKRSTSIDEARYDNIHVLPSTTDIQPFLKAFDVLVTDYSSVYYTFLQLDRPIILFPYDFALYEDRQDFQFPYDGLPGPKADSVPELLEWIQYYGREGDEFREDRRAVRRQFYDRQDGRASQCIVDSLLEE